MVFFLNGINSIFPILNRHLNFKKVPRGAKSEDPLVYLLRLSKPRASPTVSADTAMARTRGAKSSSPSTRLRIPRDAPIQDSTSEPPRPRLVPPPVKNTPTSPPARCYNTRRSLTIACASSFRGQKACTGPLKKKAKVSEPIDLTESSSEPESEPTPSPPPAKKSHRLLISLHHLLRSLSHLRHQQENLKFPRA